MSETLSKGRTPSASSAPPTSVRHRVGRAFGRVAPWMGGLAVVTLLFERTIPFVLPVVAAAVVLGGIARVLGSPKPLNQAPAADSLPSVWENFQNTGNSPADLHAKGRAFGDLLTFHIQQRVRVFEQHAKVASQPLRVSEETLVAETLAYALHYTDRIAFDHLGPKCRDPFVEGVEIGAVSEFDRAYPSALIGEGRRTLNELVVERELEYARYDLLPADPGAGPDLIPAEA